jgi:signal transduction histidine kinase
MTRSSKMGAAKKVSPASQEKIVPSRGKQMSPLGSKIRIKRWVDSIRVPRQIRSQITKAAATPFPVFIQAEKGTGTNEVAKAIHQLSAWANHPFLHFFCRDLTAEGFVQKLSKWLLCPEGDQRSISFTLFLEDADLLGWDLQTILMDLVNDHEIGWPGWGKRVIEAKIISSAALPLSKAAACGGFREDLFQTLETLSIILPPLRDRKGEIRGLVSEILKEREKNCFFGKKRFSAEALDTLQAYDWPGNIKELESVVFRSVAMKEGEVILPRDLIFRRGEGKAPPVFQGLGSPREERPSFFDSAVPTLAHEIKNPLVAISTFAHLLPGKYDDPEFREEFSRLVGRDIQRINDLLENLLEYVQLSAPQPVGNDLNLLVSNSLQRKEKILTQRGAHLTAELKDNLPPVLFDKSQLDFVVRNIFDSICSKMKDNEPLYLSTSMAEEEENFGLRGSVKLHVWHSGQDGIIRNIQKATGMESDPDFENLGFALALARKVVIRNQGDMRVEREEGAGTTIRVWFSASR